MNPSSHGTTALLKIRAISGVGFRPITGLAEYRHTGDSVFRSAGRSSHGIFGSESTLIIFTLLILRSPLSHDFRHDLCQSIIMNYELF